MARVNDKKSGIKLSGAANLQSSAIGMSPIIFMWSVEMLTVEGFAERMDISVGTVRAWISDNTLQEHRHYFRKNMIIRFPWGPELIKAIMEDGLLEQVEVETSDAQAFNKESAVNKANAVTTGLISTSDNHAIIPYASTQHKSSKHFGNILPIASEDQQSIKAVKSPSRKRRSFSGCPINPDLLK